MSSSQLEYDYELVKLMGFIDALHTTLSRVIEKSGRKDELVRRGMLGDYYVMHTSAGFAAAIKVGAVAAEAVLSLIDAAGKENALLIERPDDFVSRQGRGRHVAAVRGQGFLHAFAGLPSDLCEVLVILAALHLGELSDNAASIFLGQERYRRYVGTARSPVAA